MSTSSPSVAQPASQDGTQGAKETRTCTHDCCNTEGTAQLSPERRQKLNRRAKMLAQGLVYYNMAEFAASIIAGILAGSVALIGFGLDSAVEVASGLVIVWQFKHADPERYEARALKLIAGAFTALGLYVGYESISTLIQGERPQPSILGIAIAIASIVIMPTVSYWQRRTGHELGSASVVADSKQVLLCSAMSVALLVGLAGNAALGWWWLDPAVGLLIALLALNEAREAWQGEACACHAPA